MADKRCIVISFYGRKSQSRMPPARHRIYMRSRLQKHMARVPLRKSLLNDRTPVDS